MPIRVSTPNVSRARPAHSRVLLIDVTTPRPDRDSGSLRSFNMMRLLRSEGFAVDFLPDDRRHAGMYTEALEAIGVRVRLDVRSYVRWCARRMPDYSAVVISRYHLAEFLLPLIRRSAPQIRIILDTVDLHHLREAREAALHGDATLMRLAAVTRKRELAAISAADMTWVVSPVEAELLGKALPEAAVAVLPNLHEQTEDPPPFERRDGLLFVGGARHPPNVDAVRWLLQHIFPLIRRRLPHCTLHLVGDGLQAAVADAADPGDGVQFHGHVPDLDPLLSRCRIGLAPLRFGAGVKGKINLCMAAGMPIVGTSCAVEGMHLRHEDHALIADEEAAFADAVARLHEDEALWTRLSLAAIENVRRHFSFSAARRTIAASFPSTH